MRISELSAKTQVSVHRLRRYEAAGFIASQRSPNGYRDYDEKTVRHVVFIAMSRAMSFSLPLITEQKTLRKKLIYHISWFETKQRKSR
jgi:DNA-binding transcriptional MerR regulator